MDTPNLTPFIAAHQTFEHRLLALYNAARAWRDGFASQSQLLEMLNAAEAAEDLVLSLLTEPPTATAPEAGNNAEHYSHARFPDLPQEVA